MCCATGRGSLARQRGRIAPGQPAQDRRADVRERDRRGAAAERPSPPSPRSPRGAGASISPRDGQQRRVLARVVGAGVRGVDAVIGGHDQQVAARAGARASRRRARRSRAARGEAAHVLAVAVAPGRSRSGSRTRALAPSSASSSATLAAPARWWRRGASALTPTPANRSCDLADRHAPPRPRPAAPADSCARAARARSRAARRCARRRPRRR